MNNELFFAIPVTWDSDNAYKENEIVFDGKDAYTAIQDVPVNTALDNTEYWIRTGVVDYGEIDDIKTDINTLEANVGAITNDVTGLQNDVDDLNSDVTALEDKFVIETITLASNVTVPSNSASDVYTVPTKTGYSIGLIELSVDGAGYGNVFSVISNGNLARFKNTFSSNLTLTFKAVVLYVKN